MMVRFGVGFAVGSIFSIGCCGRVISVGGGGVIVVFAFAAFLLGSSSSSSSSSSIDGW